MRKWQVLCVLIMVLASCGPREHKTYDYTISGVVYTDRSKTQVLPNFPLDVYDLRYNDLTHGASLFDHEYSVHTDENGYFVLNIKGGKMLTRIHAYATYDVQRGCFGVRNHPEVGEMLFYETRAFYKEASKNEVYKLKDLEIYMNEVGIMGVEPSSFKRNQEIRITLPEYVRFVNSYCIRRLQYTALDPMLVDSAKTVCGCYYSGMGRAYDNNSHQLMLNIPDTVPAGYYCLMAVTYTDIMQGPIWFKRIVQIVDD